MKIGLYGIAFQSTNKGCEALAYSSLVILNKIAKEKNRKFDVFVIQKMPTKQWIKNGFSTKKIKMAICPQKIFSNLEVKFILPFHSKNKIFYPHSISKLDLVIDFTEGDSFSDIYGRERFFSDTNFKLLIMKHKIPYILGSQTIGPFKDKDVKDQASNVIKSCSEIYVRDKLSWECVKEISERTPILTTDIAFLLPYMKIDVEHNKMRIGFNPSGLLWQQKSSNSKNIDLTVDYQKYCCQVIEFFLGVENTEVYLIPHATSLKPNGEIEDDSDVIPCNELHSKYPGTKIVNIFETAMDAKSFIASLDFFIGARMHATIAAISTGIPVVPFSYSRKFEGLFGSIEYPYIISGNKDSTDDAVANTKKWYENRKELQITANNANSHVRELLIPFIDGINSYIK